VLDHHGVAFLPDAVGPVGDCKCDTPVAHDLGTTKLGHDPDLPNRRTGGRGWGRGADGLGSWRVGSEGIEPGRTLLRADRACGNLS
jgi:hypothetical protein